jgi:acyl-coenzyme A synthetase/AMP-(fatty) acid ligase
MIDIYGVTNLVATTSQIRGLLEFNQKAGFPTHSLRTLQTGGGLASPALYRRIQSELCQRVVSRFSATETGCIAVADTAVLTNIEGATGFITPWARVEIVDDHGAPLPRGRQGFIRVNTNAIAPAWTRDMAYVQSAGFSWFDPGDIGMIDERGLLFVHGRASNVINIGGAKIPAETIEALLLTQAGVREAGVISTVGPSGFEEINALVVGDGLNAEALREAVNPKLGQTPVTRVIVAPSLPKNANGKLLREELRKLAAAS